MVLVLGTCYCRLSQSSVRTRNVDHKARPFNIVARLGHGLFSLHILGNKGIPVTLLAPQATCHCATSSSVEARGAKPAIAKGIGSSHQTLLVGFSCLLPLFMPWDVPEEVHY